MTGSTGKLSRLAFPTLLVMCLLMLKASVRTTTKFLTTEKKNKLQPGLLLSSTVASASPFDHNRSSSSSSSSKNDPNETFSACLLVMDDNFRLREWLAYHYHVLPLRHLILANDKRSKLSPTPILDMFREELGMNIIEWTDEDFMNMTALLPNATAHATRERHLIRQRRFLEKCVERLHHAGHHWTACYDTDEVVSINPQTKGMPFAEVTGRRDDDSLLEQPGAVLEYIRKAQALGRNTTNLRDEHCMILSRLLYGSVETDEAVLQRAIPEGLTTDPYRLDTIRWQRHNTFKEKKQNGIGNGLGKPLIDVSQLGAMLPVTVRNPHRLIDALCAPPFPQFSNQAAIRVNHYLGSWEQYSFREDSRKGIDRSREAWEYRSQINRGGDRLTRHWLKGFVGDVGLAKANRLLHDTGIAKEYQREKDASWAVNTTADVFNNRNDRHHQVFLDFVKHQQSASSLALNHTNDSTA